MARLDEDLADRGERRGVPAVPARDDDRLRGALIEIGSFAEAEEAVKIGPTNAIEGEIDGVLGGSRSGRMGIWGRGVEDGARGELAVVRG